METKLNSSEIQVPQPPSHLTWNDFTEYRMLNNSLEACTANKGVPLKIKGSGTIFLKHQVNVRGNTVTIQLDPVYYIPGLSV